MRRAALLLGLGGCQDPSIDVSVRLPAGLDVASVSVSVLLTDELGCDDVAFGLVDEGAIALAEVTSATFDGSGGSLAAVPRLGDKLWVAEARDASGVRVAGGCAAHGDIDDDLTVAIDTEAVADVIVAPHAPDAPLEAEIDVRVDDGAAVPEPIAGRPVRWAIRACPAGDSVESSDDVVTDADGLVTLPLDPPDGWGPQSLEVRARWGAPQPVVVPAFQGGHDDPRSIASRCGALVAVETTAWRAIEIDGAPALLGLAQGAATHLYAATRTDDGCVAVPDASTFTVVRDADGLDHAVVVTATEWHEYTFGPGVVITPGASGAWSNPTGEPPRAVTTVRRCRDDDPDLVLVQLDDADGTLLAFRANGAPWPDNPLVAQLNPRIAAIAELGVVPRVTAAGCIREETLGAFQAVLVEGARGDLGDDPAALRPRWVMVDGRGLGVAVLPVPSFGAVAFSPADVVDDPVLLGGTISPTGPKVVRWRLVPVGDALQLREEVRDDALGPPASLAIGHLDDDAHLDTVWGLVDALAGGVEESRLQLAERCGPDDAPLLVNGISEQLAEGIDGAAAVFLAADTIMLGASTTTVFIDTTP